MIRKETWVILGLFIVALAGLLIWQRSQEDAASEAAEFDDRELLFDLGESRPVYVRLERVGERVVELERDQADLWQVTWPTETRGDSEALESTLSQLSSVAILGRMENPPSLEEMGLAPPAFRLLIKLEDGKQLSVSVGRLTPTGSAFYVLNSDRTVSLVNNYSLEPILGLLENLPLAPLEETPAPYPESDQPVDPGLEPTSAP